MTVSLIALFFLLGALAGSFVGVVAERAYTGQSWKTGRSRCNSCRTTLTPRDLVPALSWLMHRGRCRHCGALVPGLYALYELALGLAFAAAYAALGIGLPLLLFLAALCVLAFIVVYDLRHTLIPSPASTLFIALSALYALSAAPSLSALAVPAAYAAGIALFFFCLYAFSRGRAMGLGDTPLSFGLALLAGERALAGFLFSFWIGGVIGILILVLRKGGPRMGIEVPFAPFLAAGFLLAFFTQWNPLPF